MTPGTAAQATVTRRTATVASVPAMALVDEMANEVLAAQRRVPSQAVTAGAVPVARIVVPELEVPDATEPPRAAGQQTHAVALPLDAEQIADLVNEVLAEQARRHGVDLS